MLKPAKDKLLASIFTNSPGLVNLWAKKADIVTNTSTPWAAAAEDILRGPIALVTTAGIHLIGQPPYDMDDPEGDASFREIPSSVPAGALTITHNYYDHRDADADINVVLPFERLKDLEREGFIGKTARRHFSFMGHILGSRLERLVGRTAPALAAEMKKDGIRAALLTPGWGYCNQSVGLIQRAIEQAGIPTLSISLNRTVTEKVMPPRAVLVGYPLGHPMGRPFDKKTQTSLLKEGLTLLRDIRVPGTLVDASDRYRL